jgi:hypothetical protein
VQLTDQRCTRPQDWQAAEAETRTLPPICAVRGRDQLIVVAEQIGVFCVLSRSAALENQPPRDSLL